MYQAYFSRRLQKKREKITAWSQVRLESDPDLKKKKKNYCHNYNYNNNNNDIIFFLNVFALGCLYMHIFLDLQKGTSRNFLQQSHLSLVQYLIIFYIDIFCTRIPQEVAVDKKRCVYYAVYILPITPPNPLTPPSPPHIS